MNVFTKIAEIQQFSLETRKNGKAIALVPTMGFLHEGHLSLLDIAAEHADIVIVTIFVNPTQFAPGEDFDKYPRNLERDCELCEKRLSKGNGVVFAPDTDEIYFPDTSTRVVEEVLSRKLCGKSRPAHFQGVTTIVTKLFNATLPDIAVFGQKDAQQALIIKRMVRDLNFPIRIIVGPLVREDDGLALSSRNKYLSAEERQHALSISKALFEADASVKHKNIRDAGKIVETIKNSITEAGGRIDYVEAVNCDNLEPVAKITRGTLIATAAFFGNTRLIDNIIIESK